jgi:hypothetical protein
LARFCAGRGKLPLFGGPRLFAVGLSDFDPSGASVNVSSGAISPSSHSQSGLSPARAYDDEAGTDACGRHLRCPAGELVDRDENIGNAPLPALVGIIAAMAEVWATECGPARRFRNCSSLASIEHRRFSFITGNWRRLNIQHLSKSL